MVPGTLPLVCLFVNERFYRYFLLQRLTFLSNLTASYRRRLGLSRQLGAKATDKKITPHQVTAALKYSVTLIICLYIHFGWWWSGWGTLPLGNVAGKTDQAVA